MKSEQINELAAALVKAQGEFPTVSKDSENPFFKSKYADLATVTKAAQPVLTANGLAVSQLVTNDGNGGSLLKTYLLHSSGQYICEEMPLMIPKGTPQDQGSAITYARRYSYMAILGLVADEDDDGNKASAPGQSYVKPYAKSPNSKLIHPDDLRTLKQIMGEKGFTGEKATQLAQAVIGKDKPETPNDVEALLDALRGEAA